MSEMKSAFEIAMEKIEKMSKPTNEERLKWKYNPEGEKLATRYLKDGCNLVTELSKYEETARKHVVESASDILVRNINLPRDNFAKKNNKQAMDGLKNMKSNKVATENVFSKIRHIFNHYTEQGEQQRRQAYESLKVDFEKKMQQAVQQQLGTTTGIKIDVEKQPQFQQEWRKVLSQLDSQYLDIPVMPYTVYFDKSETINVDKKETKSRLMAASFSFGSITAISGQWTICAPARASRSVSSRYRSWTPADSWRYASQLWPWASCSFGSISRRMSTAVNPWMRTVSGACGAYANRAPPYSKTASMIAAYARTLRRISCHPNRRSQA